MSTTDSPHAAVTLRLFKAALTVASRSPKLSPKKSFGQFLILPRRSSIKLRQFGGTIRSAIAEVERSLACFEASFRDTPLEAEEKVFTVALDDKLQIAPLCGIDQNIGKPRLDRGMKVKFRLLQDDD